MLNELRQIDRSRDYTILMIYKVEPLKHVTGILLFKVNTGTVLDREFTTASTATAIFRDMIGKIKTSLV